MQAFLSEMQNEISKMKSPFPISSLTLQAELLKYQNNEKHVSYQSFQSIISATLSIIRSIGSM